MFENMINRIKEDILGTLFRIQLAREEPEKLPAKKKRRLNLIHGDNDSATPATVRRTGKKIGRNDPCPCGSGKKYKKCCGANK